MQSVKNVACFIFKVMKPFYFKVITPCLHKPAKMHFVPNHPYFKMLGNLFIVIIMRTCALRATLWTPQTMHLRAVEIGCVLSAPLLGWSEYHYLIFDIN